MNILVFDVGTSSMRGVLYQEDGRKLYSKQLKHQPVHGAGGRVVQNAFEFEEAMITIFQCCAEAAKELHVKIDAISMTAQRSSVVPVDKNGNPLSEIIMWQDTRSQGVCQEIKEYDDEVAERSGASINTVFSGSKMLYLKKDNPRLFDQAYKLVNIPEFLNIRMTGEFATDHTYGSRSNLMNIRTRSWDKRLLAIYGIPEEKLLKLYEPGAVIGTITETFAKQTGLAAGIPVISAGGDQQCAAVGQGAFREGVISVVAGTGAFLVAACNHVPDNLTKQVICSCSSVRNTYIVEASVLTCCSAFDWFLREFYDWENGIDYDRVNRELEEVYEKNLECEVLPYFQGRATPIWNPNARAVFGNISLSATRADFLKAILEGIFMEVKNNMDMMKQYVELDSAYISGGLTNSHIVNQMQSDVYGLPLYRLEESESTAAGALMIALQSMGAYKDLDEIFMAVQNPKHAEKYEMNGKKHEIYLTKQKEMNQLYNKIYA